MFVVKSMKKNGSYFGKFKSDDEALEAAVKANEECKWGADDWEPEEKAGQRTDATRRFSEVMTNITNVIQSIERRLLKYNAREANWAHVGDVSHVLENLKEIDVFLASGKP